jgi:hypothetical protein
MKKCFCYIFLLSPIAALSQWNITAGENTTPANVVTSGIFKSTHNYGLELYPINSDAIIRRHTSGNLVLCSGGQGTPSEIRLNFSYNSGSGGVSIFDGGQTNHANFKVSSNGNLAISPSGGSTTVNGNQHVNGNLSLGAGINGTVSTITGAAFSGAIQIKMNSAAGGASNRYLRLGMTDNNAAFTPVISLGEDTNVGVGTTTPMAKFHTAGGTTSTSISNLYNTSTARFDLANPAISLNIGYVSADIPLIQSSNNYLNSPTALSINPFGGNVGIGTTTPGSFKLAVNGKIWTQEVNVAMDNPGPDYVFEKDYNLLPLSELETYINTNKHLPEVPSAKEMEAEGLNLKEMNLLLLKKVEELTLHLIEQQKQIDCLKSNTKK